MIRMPRHLADDLLDGDDAGVAPLTIDGWDLAAFAEGVRRTGGDPDRFARRIAAAHEAAPQLATEPDLVRTVIALAAWRSGAQALRNEALGRLAALPEGAYPQDAAAAALALPADALAEFAAQQRADRFWWPGRAEWNGYVCAVGGFAGLGGAWVEPPTDGRVLDSGQTVFAVRSGETWWRIDADVWGSRLTRLVSEPGPPVSSPATIVTRPDSYLAWLHVRDAA
jgi:hypothetical protein